MVGSLCNGEWQGAPQGVDGPVAQPHPAHPGSYWRGWKAEEVHGELE